MFLNFTYRNHREIIADRLIIPYSIKWEEGHPDYKHPPGYVLHGMDQDRQAPRSFLFTNIIPKPGTPVLFDFTSVIDKVAIEQLVKSTQQLINSVKKDEFGTAIAQFRDGNGGLVSKETLELATQTERLLAFYK